MELLKMVEKARDKTKEPDRYWAGDNRGCTCSVPGCRGGSVITKHASRTDEKIRFCSEHRLLSADDVVHMRVQQ